MSLTLPGTLPGLLRRCSPLGPDDFGVVGGVNPEMDDNRTHLVIFHEGYDDWHDPKTLHLDLEDETGRAHAAWWLAEQVAIESPGPWMHCHSGRWGFRGDSKRWSRRVTCTNGVAVPALADLDPNNPRLLPDGSRWVDAEALRLACLHVGGGA